MIVTCQSELAPWFPKVRLINGSIESMTPCHGFDRRKNTQESHPQPENRPIKLVGIHSTEHT